MPQRKSLPHIQATIFYIFSAFTVTLEGKECPFMSNDVQ